MAQAGALYESAESDFDIDCPSSDRASSPCPCCEEPDVELGASSLDEINSSEWSGLRQNFEQQGIIKTTISCPNCENEDIEQFLPIEDPKSNLPTSAPISYKCVICKKSFKIKYDLNVDGKPIDFSPISLEKCEGLVGSKKSPDQSLNRNGANEMVQKSISGKKLPTENPFDEPSNNRCVKSFQCENCFNNVAKRFDKNRLSDNGEPLIFCLVCKTYQNQQLSNGQVCASSCSDLSKSLKHRPPGKLQRTIVDDINQLRPGDHVMWQRGVAYYHHAIVESVDQREEMFTVIEYTNGPKINGNWVAVRRSELRFAEHSKSMYRVDYEPDECLSVEKTLELARSRLNGGNYGLTNHCEHFATWCKTGRAGQSGQLSTVVNRLAQATLKESSGGSAFRLLKLFLRFASKAPSAGMVGDAVTDGAAAVAGTIASEATEEAVLATGAVASKALRVVRYAKSGALAANVVVNIAVEAGFFYYYAYQAYQQLNKKKISWEDFKRELRKLGGESMGGILGGIAGGILGEMLVPFPPILGAVVGATLGNIVGRFVGFIISKIFSEVNMTLKRLGYGKRFLELPTAFLYDAKSEDARQSTGRLQCSNCLNDAKQRFRDISLNSAQCLVCQYNIQKPASNADSEEASRELLASNQSKRYVKCSQCSNSVSERFDKAKFEVGRTPTMRCHVCCTILRLQLAEDPAADIREVAPIGGTKTFAVTVELKQADSRIQCDECFNNISKRFEELGSGGMKCLVCKRIVSVTKKKLSESGELDAVQGEAPVSSPPLRKLECGQCYNKVEKRFSKARNGRFQCLVCHSIAV